MKIRIKGSFEKGEFAGFLSRTIMGRGSDGIPYKPTPNDDYHWVLDCGNDWRATFSKEESDIVNIGYRYKSETNQKEWALVEWLKASIGVEVVSV